jgi:hypothetical protein
MIMVRELNTTNFFGSPGWEENIFRGREQL